MIMSASGLVAVFLPLMPLISAKALLLVPWASQSCTRALLPACRKASLSMSDTVLLPTPPFLAITVICIKQLSTYSHETVQHVISDYCTQYHGSVSLVIF